MSNPEEEDGQIAKQKKVQEDKKRTLSYLKNQVEELDRTFAKNFAKGNFALGAHDARRMAAILDVLSEIDLTQ
jgi:hypothetical protein